MNHLNRAFWKVIKVIYFVVLGMSTLATHGQCTPCISLAIRFIVDLILQVQSCNRSVLFFFAMGKLYTRTLLMVPFYTTRSLANIWLLSICDFFLNPIWRSNVTTLSETACIRKKNRVWISHERMGNAEKCLSIGYNKYPRLLTRKNKKICRLTSQGMGLFSTPTHSHVE